MESKQANGGRARAEKLSAERRSEIASLGGRTRWASEKVAKKQKVYVIGSDDGPVKIGLAYSARNRRGDLQVGSPAVLRVFGEVSTGDHAASDIEKAVHFSLRATHIRGEWFDVSPERALEAIRSQVEHFVPVPDQRKRIGRRQPFHFRMDSDLLERLSRVAAEMHMSKTEIVEAGIDMRLDLLEGYQKMDRAPVKGGDFPPRLLPGKRAALHLNGATFVSAAEQIKPRGAGKKVDHMAMTGAKPSGWDAEGNPIYRGVK